MDCDDTDPLLGGDEVVGDGIDNDCDETIDCDDSDLVEGVWEGDASQSDIPELCDGYCSRAITGSLDILGGRWPGLGNLACVTSIAGDLNLGDSEVDLSGDVASIGNPELTSLLALRNLTTVGGTLQIYANPALTDVTPLYGLVSVGGDVIITDSGALTDEAAQALVEQIEDIGGAVTISGN